MKIYVASSWKNPYFDEIVETLRKDGYDVYDFKHPDTPRQSGFHWSEIDVNYKQWSPEQYLVALKTEKARMGFADDYSAMLNADMCVLVLPSGRSSHLEAGWMIGKGKQVIALMLEPQEPELMYKMFNGICFSVYDLRHYLYDINANSVPTIKQQRIS